MATRIGVDIGGTFTDLVYYDEESGISREGKVPTVPHAPEEGVIHAITAHVPREVIERASYFLHGTTVGLNALLERRGAKVGLITTKGMRDVLEIRRADRTQMYDLFWSPREPLVPRYLRLEAVERIRADGSIDRPLDEVALREVFARFEAEQVDSIAICLMHAYANPIHELRIAELLAEFGFTGGISISHKISGEYREYERTSTTVVDAFVRARMSDYLSRLEGELRKLGFGGECLITRSGSGSMTFREAQSRPFETIMSGPVGGAQGASELARRLGIQSLITADVGGTSFDAALILQGEPIVLYEGLVDEMPLQTPWVDVRSIGSGGGSIAYVDEGGLMRVGPMSAGAVPGPAAYGKGGTLPTTTDAAAYLGMLGNGKLASAISLNFDKAGEALHTLCDKLGEPIDTIATGILRISSSSMANTMRDLAFEKGLDLREMTLLPFGGAGPMMATLLADELQMAEIIIPVLAGNFSAWGLLGADMVQSAARTRIMPLAEASLPAVDDLVEALFAEIRSRGDRAHADAAAAASIDLRYKGQEHWLSIPLALIGERRVSTAAELAAAFEELYLASFGGTLDEPVEIVAVRATLKVALPVRRDATREADTGASSQTLRAYSFNRQSWTEFKLIPRASITARIAGPAIITESTTTTYLDSGWVADIGAAGELRLTAPARAGAASAGLMHERIQ